MEKNLTNSIIEKLNKELLYSMEKVIKEEKDLANYFSYQEAFDLAEYLYLDILILENDLYDIRGAIFDKQCLDKDLGEISDFYRERGEKIDIETLNFQKRKNQLTIKASDIDWLYNGQWIDFSNELWELREKYENLAILNIAYKNYTRVIKIYDRLIGINKDLIAYIEDPCDMISLAENYRDLAAIYGLLENTKEEEKYLRFSLDLAKKIKDEDLEISIKTNLSKSYYRWIEFLKDKARYEEAIIAGKEIIKILENCQIKHPTYQIDRSLVDLYNIVTEIYFLDKNYKESLKYAILALSQSRAFDRGLESKTSKEKLDRALLNKAKVKEIT